MDEEEAGILLTECLMDGVRVAHPESCLCEHLPPPPRVGKIFLLAGGKAAGAMMKVAVRHYLRLVDQDRIEGVAVGKPDSRAPVSHMEWIEAGHPVPDEGSVRGATRALQLARRARAGDLVIILLSGGASSLWSAPVDGVTLDDKRDVTRQLLRSGADIIEINSVRKHLSCIKGGRLAIAAAPAKCLTLAISDVVGDDPSFIASGPGVGDPTTLQEAREILARYKIQPPKPVAEALADPRNETPGPGDPVFATSDVKIIASGALALEAAIKRLCANGYQVVNLGDAITGEARDVAREHAQRALDCRSENQPVALLSGGELTVTITGRGRGGPNQEYALALAIALDGAGGIAAIAADTDGCDGGKGRSSDPAGALVYPSVLERAADRKLNPATFLADNNSGAFFDQTGDLLVIGPTHTNVNDFRLILINHNDRQH